MMKNPLNILYPNSCKFKKNKIGLWIRESVAKFAVCVLTKHCVVTRMARWQGNKTLGNLITAVGSIPSQLNTIYHYTDLFELMNSWNYHYDKWSAAIFTKANVIHFNFKGVWSLFKKAFNSIWLSILNAYNCSLRHF